MNVKISVIALRNWILNATTATRKKNHRRRDWSVDNIRRRHDAILFFPSFFVFFIFFSFSSVVFTFVFLPRRGITNNTRLGQYGVSGAAADNALRVDVG